jgi:hypothetical protein
MMMKVLFMMEVMIDGRVENGKIADNNNGPNRYARHLCLVEKLEPFVPVIHRYVRSTVYYLLLVRLFLCTNMVN